MIPKFETTHFVYEDREPSKRVERRDYKYWDADLDRGSEKSLANFVKALVYYAGKLHDAYISYDPEGEAHHNGWKCPWGKQSVHTRVSLPEGMEKGFEKMSGITLKSPPKLNVN